MSRSRISRTVVIAGFTASGSLGANCHLPFCHSFLRRFGTDRRYGVTDASSSVEHWSNYCEQFVAVATIQVKAALSAILGDLVAVKLADTSGINRGDNLIFKRNKGG